MQNMPIGIFRGDDTDAFDYQTIVGTINTDLDLTGCKAVFRYLDFSMEFDPIPEDKKITIIIPADETKKFPPGLGYASLRVYDSEDRLKTFSNRIMVFVATKTPMFGSDEFEVDFNVRATLEPLKFFVGPNPDDFDEYRGYVEKVIDRASAEKYGLAILLDAIDSDLGANDGVAATPVAVKAAYAAIIDKLTDDYYTAEQTDEAIDRVAAYYITYDAAGNPFPTYAALANAQTVYSGGKVRIPTRNDYCVVLADEMHQGAEYRYIYAVAEGQTIGSWQSQFPVEGVMTVDQTVTRNSQNPVSGGGVWSALWGALASLPAGFSSLYDWCVAQLAGKASKADATLTERGFTEWSIAHTPLSAEAKSMFYDESDTAAANDYAVTIRDNHLYVGDYFAASLSLSSDGLSYVYDIGSGTAYIIWGPVNTTVATRTALPGYVLGPGDPSNPNRDKPLASEAETEALRQGKADRAANPTAGNLAALDANGNPTDSGVKASDKLDASSASAPFSSDSSTQYPVGSHCTYNGKLYKCTTATTGGTWDASKWTADMASNYFQYALVTKTISNGAVSLDDRAINIVTLDASVTSVTFTFPIHPNGKARDFFIRLIIQGTTVPTLYFNEPDGGGAVAFDADDDSWADIESGVNILMFTDTAE
jgi:hypothetical protein